MKKTKKLWKSPKVNHRTINSGSVEANEKEADDSPRLVIDENNDNRESSPPFYGFNSDGIESETAANVGKVSALLK